MEEERFQTFVKASLQCVLLCDRKHLQTRCSVVRNNHEQTCIFMDDFHRKCVHTMPSGDTFAVVGLDHQRSSDHFRKMALWSEDDASVTLTLIWHNDCGGDEQTVTFEGTINGDDNVQWSPCAS